MRRKALTLKILIFCLGCLSTIANAADENNLPYLSGLPDQAKMLAPAKTTASQPKTYILPATPATAQWGVFDSAQKPVLTIRSGDTVIIETMAASDNQIVPGTTIQQLVEIQNAIAGRGPHTVTGPIYVEGAEPGDVLQIHFNKIVPRAYASNNTAPGKGLFPEVFSQPYINYYYLNLNKMQMQFAPGIVVPLAPFPGVFAVARKEPGKYDTIPPGPFGGNMDLREMTAGSTLYLPVFMQGGLIWSGDSHAGQGNGEIDLTAIETAFAELNVTVNLIKQKPLSWPRVETAHDWIAVGYDKDLNKALDILKDETIKLIMDVRKLSKPDAEKLMMQTWNCPIAEVVNGVQGVYCMVPKTGNAKHQPLPETDNANYFVTTAKDVDIEKAMKKAAMDMINKVASMKKMQRVDVYTLSSFALDCRIAPYQSGEKKVHCMMPKSLWVS